MLARAARARFPKNALTDRTEQFISETIFIRDDPFGIDAPMLNEEISETHLSSLRFVSIWLTHQTLSLRRFGSVTSTRKYVDEDRDVCVIQSSRVDENASDTIEIFLFDRIPLERR